MRLYCSDRVDRPAGSGLDEHETSPRETGTKKTAWRLDYIARHFRNVTTLSLFGPVMAGILTFKWLQISFHFMFFHDPSRSELIRVDPTRIGGPSLSGPTFAPASQQSDRNGIMFVLHVLPLQWL